MAEDEISPTGSFQALAPTVHYSTGAASRAAATPAVPAVAQASGADSAPSLDLGSLVSRAKANLGSVDRTVDFSVDARTGIAVAIIRNPQTGEVVQQIPGRNMIALAQMLADWSPGKHLLLDLIA